MSMPCACGTKEVEEGEKFMSGTSSAEKESTPEMTLKLEDEDENNKNDLKFDGEEKGKEDYDPDDWMTWPNKDVFIKYYQQLRESDGFEFDEYPGSCLFAPIYPMIGFENFPEFVDEIKGYASMAIKKYFHKKRKKGKEYSIKEIVRINAGGCRDFNYYITFKFDDYGKEGTFQAKVVKTIEGTIEIPICRHKRKV
ncbi:uncharacterized protein [Nicotiana tomentosiformis]|uniref:uncharacterized protein n=1 Tax=Nicotiana tomentosiformis TaxID=4098 RepID=UPI00051AF7E6|nr:uncharacterized protein LOC104117629 [Nicotiana tomentosiformis]